MCLWTRLQVWLPRFNRDPHFQRVMPVRPNVWNGSLSFASIGTLIFRG